MSTTQAVSNPFALLLNPAAVFAELERSDRLNRLTSRICRPLDKPVLGNAVEAVEVTETEERHTDDSYLRFNDE
jgi:hypothetical protein